MKKKVNYLNIVYILAFAWILGFSIVGSFSKQFWYDEIATIGYIRSDISIVESLSYYTTIEASNLPLYNVIIYYLYRLLPANVTCILLFNMLTTMLGVYYVARLAQKVMGNAAAISILVICMFSTSVITRLALFLRSYSLMFMASAMATYYLYMYLKEKKRSEFILLTLSLFLLVYSHYFGTLYFGLLGLCTLVMIITKKTEFKALLPFVVDGLLFAPWFIYTRISTAVSVDNFWIEPPAFSRIPDAVGFHLGGSKELLVIWGISVVLIVLCVILKREKRLIVLLNLAMPIIVVGGIYIYSRYINTSGGLYENRYFTVILPHLLWTIGYLFEFLYKQMTVYLEKSGSKAVSIVVFTIFGAVCIFVSYRLFDRTVADLKNQHENYITAVNYINEHGGIEDDKSVLILMSFDEVGEVSSLGWYDFFFVRQGKKAAHFESEVAESWITPTLEDYSGICDTAYIFGDVNKARYSKEDFVIDFQDDYMMLTVFRGIE